MSVGRTLRSYIFWTYERGSFHYDVMVTIILIFLFVSPHFIDFKDKPVSTVALHSAEVLVKEAGTSPSGASRFLYEMRAEEISNAAASEGQTLDTDFGIRAGILKTVEPIAGEVTVERYEPVFDTQGKTIAYRAWILR